MKEKVFCGECKHFAPCSRHTWATTGARCKSNAKDTPFKRGGRPSDPWLKNRNNDCKEFEAKE